MPLTGPRVAHVKRVFAEDDSGKLDPDIWIDVLRIEEMPTIFQSHDLGVLKQEVRYLFKWNDDPNFPDPRFDSSNADQQFENAVASRDTHQLHILDPTDQNASKASPDHVKLWIIDNLPVNAQPDSFTGKIGQIVSFKFNNQPVTGENDDGTGRAPVDRDAFVIKVVNNDLNGLKMSDDDGTNPVLTDWDIYMPALQSGALDDSQHLTVEITKKFYYLFQSDETLGGKIGQQIEFVLRDNQDVAALFNSDDPKAIDANGRRVLLRTDPLQSIVNVSFGGLAVEFYEGAD